MVGQGPKRRHVKELLLKWDMMHADPEILYTAIGILGATVMPHNLYLHSSIVQSRAYQRSLKVGPFDP